MRSNLVFLSVALVVAAAGPASADEAITGLRTRVDFTGYAGTGLVPTPAAGQLDSDSWRVLGMNDGDTSFGGSFTSGDPAEGASTGGETEGGLWAFTVASADQAFGIQQTGSDLTPGEVFLRFVNASGAPLVDPTVRFEVWIFNDQARSSEIEFAWSSDGSDFHNVSALRVTSGQAPAATPNWQVTARAVTLTGTTIANGQRLHLRWSLDDNGGSDLYDEVAIDDIEIVVAGCGDEVIQRGEACDDGNQDDGDGCSATCQVEPMVEPDPDAGVGEGGGGGGGADGDEDQDGVADDEDNCPGIPNPAQADEDDDGEGNACDYLGGDDDGSGGYKAGCDAGGRGDGGAALVLVLVALLGARRRA